MKNLFYNPQLKILFLIAGYTADDNTPKVVDKVKILLNDAEKFAKIAGCDISQVNTKYITDSPRYRFNRIFWCSSEYIENAFIVNMSMWDWIDRN